MLYLFIFWEPSGPSGARMRMNTKVRLDLPSAKPSLPRGLLRGEPPNVPKNRQCFFEKFPSLSFSYTWKKRTRGISNYGTGPAESWAAYASGIQHPLHHPTPKSLMNAKFLAEVYQSRIREHGSRVKKTRVRMHKASMGHTIDLTITNFLSYKYNHDKY